MSNEVVWGASAQRNKCCQKDANGIRQHSMKKHIDAFGHEYENCENCGAFLVKIEKEEIKNN